MSKSKSRTVSNTNQTQTAAPPTWTQPGLTDVARRVAEGVGSIPTTHYSGPMVASMDPTQLQAIMSAWQGTAANAGQLAGWEQGMLPGLQNIAGGLQYGTALPDTSYALADRQNLDNVIRASIDPVQKNLMESILPSITNSALASGAYSNDRATGVLPQTAIRDAQNSMQQIAAQLGYEDYNNYENRRLAAYQATTGASQQNYALDTARQQQDAALRLQAMGMAPDMVNSILHTQASQGDLLRMAAELQQQQQQLGINNQLGMDQYASQSPFMGLDTASALLAQLSGNWGTQNLVGHTDQTTTQSQALLPQLIQGAVGIGSAIAGMPGMGAALGGGGSALGGGVSAAQLFTPQPMSLAPAAPLASVATPNWQQLLSSLPHG